MTEPHRISVAEVKRRFSDVLGEVRYQHHRFVIERNGTPVAALVPLEELTPSDQPAAGFLGLVGAFADAPELSAALDDAVNGRKAQQPRPAPSLGS